MNEKIKTQLRFEILDLALTLTRIARCFEDDTPADGLEGPCDGLQARPDQWEPEARASAPDPLQSPPIEGQAASDPVGYDDAGKAGENRADESCDGNLEEMTDRPLKEEHLKVVKRKGLKPLGNVAFRRFIDECTVSEGQYPLVDFYRDFEDWCRKNGHHVATRKGIRYLLHRNGYTLGRTVFIEHGSESSRACVFNLSAF